MDIIKKKEKIIPSKNKKIKNGRIERKKGRKKVRKKKERMN